MESPILVVVVSIGAGGKKNHVFFFQLEVIQNMKRTVVDTFQTTNNSSSECNHRMDFTDGRRFGRTNVCDDKEREDDDDTLDEENDGVIAMLDN